MKTDIIIRLSGNYATKKVRVDDIDLSPTDSQFVRNHSTDGFNWGYSGSGPAQLALAVMLRVFSKEKALSKYQEFKDKVIALLPKSNFDVCVNMDKFEIIQGGINSVSLTELNIEHGPMPDSLTFKCGQ